MYALSLTSNALKVGSQLCWLAVALLTAGNTASQDEVRQADLVAIMACDLLEEAPMLALALGQAHRRGAPVTVLDPRPVFLPFEFEPLAAPPDQLDTALGALVKAAPAAHWFSPLC